ncbi:hypothetical protein ACFC96_12030 [Streptomyces sp. NPDC055955]|uniref:hypothetical protein n=1 Tax=Streptomyces sp. NPDC055955 TaxID=3345665 RepID=UPI0035DFE361
MTVLKEKRKLGVVTVRCLTIDWLRARNRRYRLTPSSAAWRVADAGLWLPTPQATVLDDGI